MSLKVKENTYDIDSFSKYYFSLDEKDRDITEWVPVLDKFIWSMIKKFKNVLNVSIASSMLNTDDMYQMAWIAVTKAIPKYKVEKDIKFTTFIGRCIENEFKMISRQRLKILRDRKDASKGFFQTHSIEEPIQINKDDTGYLKDLIVGEEDFTEEGLLIDTFADWLTFYRKDKNKVALDYFILKGYSQVDTGKAMSLTQSYVSKLIKEGVNDFKEYYYN